MGKIVILADGSDADTIKDALSSTDLDFEIVEPTASNILHIVIGMVDDADTGDDDGDDKKGTSDPDVAADDTTTDTEEEAPADTASDEEPVGESLGTVVVEGVEMTAFAGDRTQILAPLKAESDRLVVELAEGIQVTTWLDAEPSIYACIERNGTEVFKQLTFNDGKTPMIILDKDMRSKLGFAI